MMVMKLPPHDELTPHDRGQIPPMIRILPPMMVMKLPPHDELTPHDRGQITPPMIRILPPP